MHIDADAAEIGRNYATELGVVADAKAALGVLAEAARGVKRLVRDAFAIGGLITMDQHGHVDGIVLNQADRLAHHLLAALQALLAAEQVGHLDKLDLWLLPERGEYSGRQIDPGPRLTRAQVEESGCALPDRQMNSHINSILHVKEIAVLLSVFELRFVALKQLNLPGLLKLVEGFADQAAHFALVCFIRPKNVEILQADDLPKVAPAPGVEIEKLL